jgi:hypothetical protein
MIKIARLIEHYLAEHNIPANGFTVILNWQNASAAAHFDLMLNRELEVLMQSPTGEKTGLHGLDIRDFTLHGIHFKVESPVHEPIS